MSRVHAAHAASWIANEGLALVAGTSAEDCSALADALDFKAVAKAQKGTVADMDLINANLVETYKEAEVAA
jgi:hypothetical protein